MPVEDVTAFLQAVRLPPGAPLVNLLVPADGTEAVADAIFDSQVNVLVQPVDAADPQAVIEPLGTGSPTFAMHAAAALCTAAGLWTGMAAAPLDAEQPWSGVGVAVGRAYLRRLDATPVLDRLADEVYGTTGTLPDHPHPVRRADGRGGAGRPTGRRRGHRVRRPGQARREHQIPAAAAVPTAAAGEAGSRGGREMFFGFLRRAIPVPRRRGRTRCAEPPAAGSSRARTKFFFGDQSGYQVVLTGLSATPRGPASTRPGRCRRRRWFPQPERAAGQPVTRVPQLWDDTVRSVAALADGGDPDLSI